MKNETPWWVGYGFFVYFMIFLIVIGWINETINKLDKRLTVIETLLVCKEIAPDGLMNIERNNRK